MEQVGGGSLSIIILVAVATKSYYSPLNPPPPPPSSTPPPAEEVIVPRYSDNCWNNNSEINCFDVLCESHFWTAELHVKIDPSSTSSCSTHPASHLHTYIHIYIYTHICSNTLFLEWKCLQMFAFKFLRKWLSSIYSSWLQNVFRVENRTFSYYYK